MQKIIIISTLTAILSLPVFAEIANNATCNNTNLGQSDNNSTANVEANWNANTININWYNGDTRVAQNTCTYDGSITLPAQPTKPGYTFAGWRLRAAPQKQCWEIENEEECIGVEGCILSHGGCYVPINDCSAITIEIDCEHSSENNGVCGWNDELQQCQWNGAGGSN